VEEAAEKSKAQKIRNFPDKAPVFKASRISMSFDLFGSFLIFLTYFGHNLGTA